MTTYRITIDRTLCSGFGSCVELAPEAYELGPDGIANVLVHETATRTWSKRPAPVRWARSRSRPSRTRRRREHSAARPDRRRGPRRRPLRGDAARERLRRRPPLVGAEPVPPYERPALSKEHLAGCATRSRSQLRPRSFWDEHGIELLLGRRVISFDPARRTASPTAARSSRGTRSCSPPAHAAAAAGVERHAHALRTLADAAALRNKLRPGARVAIVGAGFVGTEVASTALSLGARSR